MDRKSSAAENIRLHHVAHEYPNLPWVFQWDNRGKSKFLNFIGKQDGIVKENQFSVDVASDDATISKLYSEFLKHVTGYMNIEGFIELLKELGVSASSVEEVRTAIKANYPSIKLSFDREPSGAEERPNAHLSGHAQAAPADERKPWGEHSARVLRERYETGPDTPDNAALPKTFEEAKAQVPGLRKWVEVKREAGLTSRRDGFDQEVFDLLVEHLRDHESGLGKWAASEDGMPRNLLRSIDSGLRQEIYALGNPTLPPDIQLPLGKPTGRPQGSIDHEKRAFAPRPNRQTRVEAPTREQLREARRIAKLGQRRGTRDGIDI